MDGENKAKGLLYSMLNSIVKLSTDRTSSGFPSPYYEYHDLLPYKLGYAENILQDDFHFQAYTVEALLHLAVRRNYYEPIRNLWPDISRMYFLEVRPDSPASYLRWVSLESGMLVESGPAHHKKWQDLREEAEVEGGTMLSEEAKRYPLFILMFLISFPFRLTSDTARWLDTQFRKSHI